MDAILSKPFIAFIIFFAFFFFYFKDQLEDISLAWWPEMTVLPTSTFTEMIRLARDETTFPLAMQPKVMPWHGNQIVEMSYY